MDNGLRVSEEQRSLYGDNDSDLLQIVEIEPFDMARVKPVASILKEALEFINHENLDGSDTYSNQGVNVQIPKSEGRLFGYWHERCQCLLGMIDGYPVGLLVGRMIFDSILVVRVLFARDLVQNHKVGFRLIDALNPKLILAQTRKANPPENMFKNMRNAFRISESESQITWGINWDAVHKRAEFN